MTLFNIADWLTTGAREAGKECAGLRRQVRSFLLDELAAGTYTPRCDSWLTGWDPGFSRRLAERGWVGMTIPAEFGGHGHSAVDRHAVTIELLASGAPVAAHWFADRQTAPAILRYGNEKLKQRFLPAIARGECYFALGMSEPDSGSDLASVRTRAVSAAGGWLVTGRKIWTSGAQRAHYLSVLCRTGDSPAGQSGRHAGLSQLIVPLDAPGVQVRPIRTLSGEDHFNEITFDDVFVPDDMVLGAIGDGWRQVTAELAIERSGPERFLSTYPLLAVLVQGLAQTGQDRGQDQEIGELFSSLLLLRHLSRWVAERIDDGVPPEVEAAVVKDLGTVFERTVYDSARQLSPAEPDPTAADPYQRLLAQAVLQSPGFTIRGGTTEILRQVVARAVLR
jgi:alkylation response protein AidB-like acyl-CoA dehydrogenase